jgi:2-octaprenyl-6-methoxyphenol hydroxylase
MQDERIECDVLIVGGGLVGSTLALALAELPLDVVLIETYDPTMLQQPSFDARATALANGSRRILETLGIWHAIEQAAEPITHIHISELGQFGAARIEAREEGVAALGYTVENRVLGAALWSSLAHAPRLRCLAPASFMTMNEAPDEVLSTIEYAGRTVSVRSRVLVAADGARSGVRAALGIAAARDDYGQSAVIFNCMSSRPLNGLALERFTTQGPIAVLPLSAGRAGIVWTHSTAAAADAVQLDDESLRERLDAALGGRIGRIERIGERVVHPLYRVRAAHLYGVRTVLAGSAAVNLHPVAGQGFNLALRDVASLAEVFADELARGGAADIGSAPVLRRYADWRRADQGAVAQITHGLVRVFGLPLPCSGKVRGFGLTAFDLVPGAKSLFARHAMGRAGRLPRLACGRPLRE